MDEQPPLPAAADYRQRRDDARADARSYFGAHLAEVLGQCGADAPDTLAAAAMDALFEWRRADSDARCECSCHPQLPDRDDHDHGNACVCTRTVGQRRAATRQWLDGIQEFWTSPEGQRIRAARDAAETDLRHWLGRQHGVVVTTHGGWAPEQWHGEVDGHGFYFRERHDEWRIELDAAGAQREKFGEGVLIARGTTDAEDYGVTVVERAQFIVNAIRDHLVRSTCRHHPDRIDRIAAVLGARVRWCPSCGTPLHVV